MYATKARHVKWKDWFNATTASEAWEVGVPETEEGAADTGTDAAEGTELLFCVFRHLPQL